MLKFFEKFPEIKAVMSAKEDGSMKILPSGVNNANRSTFFKKIGIAGENVFGAVLIHSNNVKKVSPGDLTNIPDTDALVTKDKKCFISITVADCLPVFFYESEKKIIGIAHAGWRGLLGGVIENTMDEIFSLGGSGKNLHVVFGPAINQCHFQIKDDILDNFKKYSNFIESDEGKYFVDLKGIAKNKIVSKGVFKNNVEDLSSCTYEDKNLFSFRRDQPKEVEAMIALIGII